MDSASYLQAVKSRKVLEQQLQSMQNKILHVKHLKDKQLREEHINKHFLEAKNSARARHHQHSEHKKRATQEKEKDLEERRKSVASLREERKNACSRSKLRLKSLHKHSYSTVIEQSKTNDSFVKQQKDKETEEAKARAKAIVKSKLDLKEKRKIEESSCRAKVRRDAVLKVKQEKEAQEKMQRRIQKVRNDEIKNLENFLNIYCF